jgi:prepilin-type processing-associated H-X9-DG protein
MQIKRNGWGQHDDRTSFAYGRFADPPTISYTMVVKQISADNNDLNAIETAISELGIRQSEPQGGAGMFSEFGGQSGMGQLGPTPPGFTIPHIEPAASRALPLGSTHGPMVNAVFADGRVVTIDQAIDETVYAQIGIRNDGQPLAKPLVELE